MKKLFALLLSLVLVFTFAACSNKDAQTNETKGTGGNEKETSASTETTDRAAPSQDGTEGNTSAASGGDLEEYPVTDGDIVEEEESLPSSSGDLNG